jgi:hypothetical protein
MVMAMLSSAVVGASCTGTDEGAEEIGVVRSAITQISISGKITFSNGSPVPGVPVQLNGKSQATQITNATGNYAFTGLATGSYSVRPEKTGCAFSPDVVNLNNQTTNATKNFTASGTQCTTSGPAKAMVIIDSRLYAQLGSTFDTWRSLVEARRGFSLDVRKDQQYDDVAFATMKSTIISARAANPALEGVLMIGNITLPSFYKIRADIPHTRLLPRYYEDLDGVFSKIYPDGSVDPVCQPNDPPGTKCVVSPRVDGSGPVTVIKHDFDDTALGPNPDPEIWTSYMPVGVAGTSNTYTDFANQLRPYFQKLINFYGHQYVTNGKYYLVANGDGDFATLWNAFGKTRIDFYGKDGPNGETGSAYLTPSGNVCYVRWPLENYATSADFLAAYNAMPWVAENWQQDSIFISHMNANTYAVDHVLTHGDEYWALIGTAQARALTSSRLITFIDGCGAAGMAQPGAPAQSGVDTTALASDNVLMAYLYGTSKTLAGFGAPNLRVEYSEAPTLVNALMSNGTPTSSYLGAANLVRTATARPNARHDRRPPAAWRVVVPHPRRERRPRLSRCPPT